MVHCGIWDWCIVGFVRLAFRRLLTVDWRYLPAYHILLHEWAPCPPTGSVRAPLHVTDCSLQHPLSTQDGSQVWQEVWTHGPCKQIQTKWMPFCRQHFQTHFPQWEFLITNAGKRAMVEVWAWCWAVNMSKKSWAEAHRMLAVQDTKQAQSLAYWIFQRKQKNIT